jgi:predicted MFS family arabinose efflux permease
MPRALEAVVGTVLPARLGAGYRWLWSASTLTNIGDGIVLAAGPLLVASQTRDPFVVSLAFFCEFLPSLVFGTFAGVVVDRMDRRRIVILVNLARAGVLAVLATTIATGSISIAIVLLGLLLLGTAETFADLASTSLLPRLVPRESIGLANARLQSGYLLMNQLIGPPIGAFLFVAGMAIPFATDAVCYALGAVLVSRIASSVARGPATESGIAEAAPAAELTATASPASATSVWRDLADGFRWLRTNPPMRTLALTIVAFNVTFGAAWSVLVLYAGDRLGMDSVGFGLLTTASAIGGIIGTAAYGALERRISLADLMRIGLLIETGTHLIFALTRSPEVALLTMVVFGAHEVVWWTTSITIRQRAVPDELMGRVGGIYTVGLTGGIVIGTPIGGLLARSFGITAPFWFGFVGSALLVAVLWRELRHIAHAGEAQPEPAGLAT